MHYSIHPCAGGYLTEAARSLPNHPDDPQRDAHHGGHSHEPADTIAPVRVGIHIVVLERFIFDQEEQENSLQEKKDALGLKIIASVSCHFKF